MATITIYNLKQIQNLFYVRRTDKVPSIAMVRSIYKQIFHVEILILAPLLLSKSAIFSLCNLNLVYLKYSITQTLFLSLQVTYELSTEINK